MQNDGFLHRPREAMQCLLIGICFVWQWYVGLLGLVLFLIVVRGLRYPAWQICLMGILLAVFSVLLIELQAPLTLSFLKSFILVLLVILFFGKLCLIKV